jgi:DNA primase
MNWAAGEYQKFFLDHPEATEARKYLTERKLSGPTVRQFGVGFAPLDGEWLVNRARTDAVPMETLVEVGLIAERDESRGYYDRFRDRIIFPIRDVQGRTVGFGGRILPSSPYAQRGPKYYNSAETPLFKKSECLFGIDQARHAGSKEGYLAVVEGYTDVMAAHQNGVNHVVATMGTALNASHVAQLRRYVPKVVLVFDADEGGMSGVDRALEIFVGQDAELAVASLPDGLDPADLLGRDGGKNEFCTALQAGRDALEFKLDRLLANQAPGIEGARKMIDAVLGILALAPAVPSSEAQIKRELILTRLAHRLNLPLKIVRDRHTELQAEARRKQRVANDAPKPAAPARPQPAGPQTVLERQLLQLLLAEPTFVPVASAAIPADAIEHSGIRRIIEELYILASDGIADLDGLRLRVLDRPDLYRAALDNQSLGRGIPDRPAYLQKVIAGFAKLREDTEKAKLKTGLASVASEEEKLAFLATLQQRAAAAKPTTVP